MEHASRVAGVLQLFEDLSVAEIGPAAMEGGIELTQYHLSEILRLINVAAVPAKILQAHQLWEWLERSWEAAAIYPTPIYRTGPSRSLRTKAAAMAALELLEEHGWLRRLEGGAEIEGAWRRDAWAIHGRRALEC